MMLDLLTTLGMTLLSGLTYVNYWDFGHGSRSWEDYYLANGGERC